MSQVRVLAAVVDTKQLTLYLENDKTIFIAQGDPRLRRIVNEITPILSENLVATVDLGNDEIPDDTVYQDYEKKAGGFTKFFRVLKTKVAHIFVPPEPVKPQVLGNVYQATKEPTASVSNPEVSKLTSAIDEIIAHAEPVSAEGFSDKDTSEHHTIIAVVKNDAGEDKIIPGVENIKSQLAASNLKDNQVGMQAFMKRLANVITDRGHTVEDILKFMERGDLPVADDGCILAYKVLKTTSSTDKNLFVDCHTGKVLQRVGSFVCMDPSMVDPNRGQDCSNGLHIARRGYLGGFSGNIIVLTKVAPEDVIAVPRYDANKVRVCGYHILSLVPEKEHKSLRSNKAIQGTEAQRLLTMAIAGDHVSKIEEVRITGGHGEGVIITPLIEAKVATPKPTTAIERTQAIPDVKEPEPIKLDAPAVDVKSVVKQVTKAKTVVAVRTRNEQVGDLIKVMTSSAMTTDDRRNAAVTLATLKKTAKVSYAKLGVTTNQQEVMEGLIANKAVVTPVIPAKAKPSVKKPVAEKPKKPVVIPKAIAKVIEERKTQVKQPEIALTRNQRAMKAFTEQDWVALEAIKKAAKVSWSTLGFNESQIAIIIKR